jgi:WD40 repeat protein
MLHHTLEQPSCKTLQATAFVWHADIISCSAFNAAAMLLPLQDVCYNADGSQIISCSSDATVRIWDAKTCEQLHGFR